MRINKYLAQATGMSRRAADDVLAQGRVTLNGKPATPGASVEVADTVQLDGHPVRPPTEAHQTIMLNKPTGFVCSRDGQGSQTIYELIPQTLHRLKPVGRLDKDSSGLILLTTDGNLANQLTHPRYQKTKTYEVTIDKPLAPHDQIAIARHGVNLPDGPSRFALKPLNQNHTAWQIAMQEGRNRQIRRTFAALGYRVTRLHRTQFGPYVLGNLAQGSHKALAK